MAEDAPSASRAAAMFLAFAEGDIRSPSQPGGQGNRAQRKQPPAERLKRKKRHLKNKAKDNRASKKRYHMKYKRKPRMKKRQPMYRKNPNKYNRQGPRK